MAKHGKMLRMVFRVALSLAIQGAVLILAVWWFEDNRRPWSTGLLAPLGSLPFGGSAKLILAMALALGWSVASVAKGRPSGTGWKAWLRLAAWNFGGACVFCAVSAACAYHWPVPRPLLTPFETDPAAKTEYLSWYESGYRDGLLGAGRIICVLGWSREDSRGYWSGYDGAFEGGPIEALRRFLGSESWGTAAMAALLRGDLKRADWELGRSVDARDSHGRTLLMIVGESGLDLPDYVRSLIQRGADVNATDRHGYTPLMYAVGWKRPGIARLLIEAGASVAATNSSGSTPLHIAAGQGGKAVVELLLDHGAPVDARDNRGSTPLMWAATSGQAESAEVLIAAGADVNARDGRCEPVLMRAAWPYRDDANPVVKVLLDHGADLEFAEGLESRDKARLHGGN
jgi:hypothetical protein